MTRFIAVLFAAILLMGQGTPSPQALYKAGFDARVAHDYPAAIRLLSAAIATGKLNNNDLVTSYNNRGMAFAATDQPDKALADYAMAIKLAPVYGPAYLNRGNVYLNQGKLDAAIKEFSAAITISSSYHLAFNSRGAAYLRKGQLDAALADLNSAIRLQPDYGNAYWNRARVYMRKSERRLALADFNEAIKFKPNEPELRVDRGNVLADARDYAAAVTDYTAAIALAPQVPLAYNQRASAYFFVGAVDKAIADYDSAIKLNADYPDPYTSRGRIELFHLDKAAAAAEDLAAGVRLDPKDIYAAIWLHIARARAGTQDRDELKANADRLGAGEWPWPVIELFVGNATPDEVLRAAADADDASKRHEQQCEAAFYLGQFNLTKGARDEAKKSIAVAVDKCPADMVEASAAKAELARLSK